MEYNERAAPPPPDDSIAYEEPTGRIDRFLATQRPPTPCVVVDLDIVRAQYAALHAAMPAAEIYYAVKANPAPQVISALAALGARFDLASPGEIEICRKLDIPAGQLSFGNTIKRESAIAEAAAGGIQRLVPGLAPRKDIHASRL